MTSDGSKEWILVANAGHRVSLAMPDRLLAEFMARVRPLAVPPPVATGNRENGRLRER